MLRLLAPVAAASSTALAANCTRESLKTATDAYIAAQAGGKPAAWTALSSTTNYTENYKATSITSSILSQPLTLAHNRSSYDTTQCATYTELIVTDAAHPYVIGTQMRFSPDGGGAATSIETLVTDRGDWLFNATGTYYWASREDWGMIPEAQRDSRAVIQAAADAYLDYFNDKSVKVPWGTPCARLEGGSYTGQGRPTDSCNVGVPSGVHLTQRRYVIDETVGAVDVHLSFESLPDSHEFRIEGGKIRYVHTQTVM
ncbi:hypothetical protein NKR23_g5313 [Pleurostoma richardsiae]|uniref:DUF8021 domain-containing protein n=1 Tax=Pleurostoma richardsiae TaxID=41990 RepID=A0AA38S2E4_9PEZI|nr:hypothetical protein NKR23_g5313 [Pleurostoma richardsiae]